MPDEGQPPILNPVLALRQEARRAAVTGGGKQLKHIRTDRFAAQQRKLAADLRAILAAKDTLISFAGHVRLVARMFDDSLATSFTPAGLISPVVGSVLVVPVHDGYVFETTIAKIPDLITAIEGPTNVPARVDISRISTIEPYSEADILRERSVESLWQSAMADGDGRLFIAWLSPLRDPSARAALMGRVEQVLTAQPQLATSPTVRLIEGPDRATQRVVVARENEHTSIAGALRRYRNTGHGMASVKLASPRQLSEFIASGLIHRIDPVRPLRVTAAGDGREPGPPPPDVSRQPIVGIVDGGMTATSYQPAEAWRAPDFVPTGRADTAHGNKVTSLVVQGHAWNGNLQLPKLFCRFGTVQAVPKLNSGHVVNSEQFISYIDRVIASHPDTKVWNLSFNETDPIDPNVVSYLGHNLSRVARERGVLLVIAGGNKLSHAQDRIQAPSDCEAALVVSGRKYDESGAPGEHCPACAPGLGPQGMLKPDLSWYSPLRMIGGIENQGSSFPTGLVSSLAAHTFDNLRDPTPDVVRALLINSGELHEHDRRLGWGTPYQGFEPWVCQPGGVTFLWTSNLRTKTAYYWEGIPIPDELIRNGKLYGKASLTAVLNPRTRDEGDANYFITRVQVSLQYEQQSKWQSLLGSMREDTEAEMSARTDLAKWYPIRCHRRDFTKRDGISFKPGSTMRVFARVFSRDLYQLNLNDTDDLGEHEVAFALTFNNGSDDSDLYNAMRANLGNFVESAVLEPDISLET